jgi:hypothetical protein
MVRRVLFLFLALSLNAFATNIPYSEDITWKSIFISGDDSIKNFDQARIDLSDLFATYGALEENQIHLSAERRFIGRNGVQSSTLNNIKNAFESLNASNDNDGCLIYMTSHGKPNNGGFVLSSGKSLKPKDLANFVNKACGTKPTVILISACFSGQFITSELTGDNRIILTAAIKDRPSFGCDPDIKYTFWDGCLIEEIPSSDTWKEAYKNVKSCIEKKETELGATPSLPQAYFGRNIRDYKILRK